MEGHYQLALSLVNFFLKYKQCTFRNLHVQCLSQECYTCTFPKISFKNKLTIWLGQSRYCYVVTCYTTQDPRAISLQHTVLTGLTLYMYKYAHMYYKGAISTCLHMYPPVYAQQLHVHV